MPKDIMRDFETIMVKATVLDQITEIIREAGIMVPRKSPGRKAQRAVGKAQKAKLQKAPSGSGPAKPDDTTDDEDED